MVVLVEYTTQGRCGLCLETITNELNSQYMYLKIAIDANKIHLHLVITL